MDRGFSLPGKGVGVSTQLLDTIRLFTIFVLLFVYFLLIIHTPTRSTTPLSPPQYIKWGIT